MALSPAHGLAVLRAAFGLYFVVSALNKLATGWLTSADPLTRFVGRNLEQSPVAYASFLEGVVLPHAMTFALLVVFGELTAGLLLYLGLFTRLGGLVGAWLVLNFMLAKGLLNDAGSNDRLFFVACLTFGLAGAGLAWGLDGALRTTLEANPLTRWLAGIPGPSHWQPTVAPVRPKQDRAA
jgi:uncharacterized membrane protein YphA (DoxX/SURF4 family)